jgi:integrase
VKKRNDGRYVKAVTDPVTGARIYFYGATEREVTLKLLAYTEAQRVGKPFSEVAQEWWDAAELTLAPQSVKSYRAPYRMAVAHFGNKSVKNITPMDVSSYLRIVAKDGASKKTVMKYKSVLSMILDVAIASGYIETNPCMTAIVPRMSTQTIKRTAASKEDEEIVRKTYNVWLLPYFALMTGMRKGEILALQWKDIDFNRNRISVTKSVYHQGDRPHIKEPKTKKGTRTVPLLSPLKSVLQEIGRKSKEELLFSDDGVKPLTNRRYITLYTKYKEETGITCTLHQLRHSFATIAFECGVPVKSVQEILGHKNIATTMDLYTDFRDRSIDAAAALLESNFDEKVVKK